MAKRANPFSEDFIPQSKVHVGDKQFNNSDDRLQKVYEKTIELLFKGAKKVPAPDPMNNNDLHINKREEKMRQLFIGKDGSLLHSGNVLQRNTSTTKCCKCGSVAECQCSYCETGLCGSCEVGCQRCQNSFCTHCIIVGSEGPEVCVSCYG